VRAGDSANAEKLAAPFISWLEVKLGEFRGPLSGAGVADAQEPMVIGARRDEGITEVFFGDDTEEALLSF
jgi:hypothetical protein